MPWHCTSIHQKNGAKTSRVAQIHLIVAVAVNLTEGDIEGCTIID